MGKSYNDRTWVNIKELRARLRFADVLRHFGVAIAARGEQHQGPCPLPSHKGLPNVAPFSAHLGRGIFQCFGCRASGNLIEFAALMRSVDPEDGAAFRGVAVELQEALVPKDGEARKAVAPPPTQAPQPRPAPPAPDPRREALVNAPLDFELKDLEVQHPALVGGMLEPRTVAHFGAGFCSRGMLKGKAAIPLHDPAGRLIGYAGADTGGRPIDRCVPAYSFPQGRERKGVRLEFDPGLLLYNAHRVGRGLDELIVAPDPVAVWWLHQCGFRAAVCPFGDELSERQAGLIAEIVKPSGRTWVFLPRERDESRVALSLLIRLSNLRFVRTVAVPRGGLVSDLGTEALSMRFAG